MERGKRRKNHGADAADWRKLRLVSGEIHAVARAFTSGTRSICTAVRRGADLPRALHGELVPKLSDDAERFGSRARGAARNLVAHPLPRCGFERVTRCGDDAAGDDVGRYRGG